MSEKSTKVDTGSGKSEEAETRIDGSDQQFDTWSLLFFATSNMAP